MHISGSVAPAKTGVCCLLLLTPLFTAPAFAAAEGMYLCRSPVVANDLWNDVTKTQQAGVRLNREILKNIAEKNECSIVLADDFKPIDFIQGSYF
jgi:hypothetical protein